MVFFASNGLHMDYDWLPTDHLEISSNLSQRSVASSALGARLGICVQAALVRAVSRYRFMSECFQVAAAVSSARLALVAEVAQAARGESISKLSVELRLTEFLPDSILCGSLAAYNVLVLAMVKLEDKHQQKSHVLMLAILQQLAGFYTLASFGCFWSNRQRLLGCSRAFSGSSSLL